VLRLPERVTLEDAPATLRMLAQALRRETDAVVVADASGLQRFDSAVLAVLLECRRLAEAAGQGFAVRQPPPKLVELSRLYGLDEALPPVSPPLAA
jgi:phospholipid transport system transporter-binding protein